MKKITTLLTLFVVLINLNCESQIIVNLDSNNGSSLSGHYYKDTFELLDPYVGTWVYVSGATTFRIKIVKKINYYSSSLNCNYDILFGEYEYIESGVPIINTLSLINDININPSEHNLRGRTVLDYYDTPICSLCNINIPRVRMFFTDPERKYLNTFSYIGIKDGEPNKMVFFFKTTGSYMVPFDDSPGNLRVPEGKYILTKE